MTCSDTEGLKDRAMEHPYALNGIRRKLRDRKKAGGGDYSLGHQTGASVRAAVTASAADA